VSDPHWPAHGGRSVRDLTYDEQTTSAAGPYSFYGWDPEARRAENCFPHAGVQPSAHLRLPPQDMSRTFQRRARARRGPSRRRTGFTLIEILVVIVVIAILATLVAPNVFQHVGAAKSATAKSQIEMLGAALDAYRLDNGSYPTSQQGLEALWTRPAVDPPANWRGPYLRKPVPADP